MAEKGYGAILFYNLEGAELHYEGIKYSWGSLLVLSFWEIIIPSTLLHFPPKLLLHQMKSGELKKPMLQKQRLQSAAWTVISLCQKL